MCALDAAELTAWAASERGPALALASGLAPVPNLLRHLKVVLPSRHPRAAPYGAPRDASRDDAHSDGDSDARSGDDGSTGDAHNGDA
jgi:hypothetical protein